jgi:hypothetical protein
MQGESSRQRHSRLDYNQHAIEPQFGDKFDESEKWPDGRNGVRDRNSKCAAVMIGKFFLANQR